MTADGTKVAADPGVTATIRELFRGYPLQSVSVVVLTVFAGLSEAVGLITLLPLLAIVTGDEQQLPLVGDVLTGMVSRLGMSPSIGLLLAVISLVMVLKGVLRFLAMRQAGYAAARVERDLRLALIRSLMRARWAYFTAQPLGQLTNAVSSEAVRARQVFTKSTELLAKLVQTFIYIVVALVVSWQVALLTVVLGGVMVLALRFLVRLMRRAGRQETKSLKSLTARLSDGLYALKPLKAMGREDNLQPLLENETEDLNAAARGQARSWAMLESAHEPIITIFISLIIFLFFVVLGAPFSEVIFIAFLLYRTVTYVSVMQKSAQAFFMYESAYWSIKQAVAEADTHAEALIPGRPLELRQRIAFDRVTFDYDGDPVLSKVSFTIPANALTALVGPSGSGKTTIADLLVGFYHPSAGDILIDEIPLRDGDLRAWRQGIGYVPQELILFNDTVFINVGLGDPGVSRQDVEDALRDAGAWDFVRSLPGGLDAPVGEHGMRLSGGQRQRLAIARALVRHPQLLILDEATTALDPETEQAILVTLRRLKSKVTIVAISHQAGIVGYADEVFRLLPAATGAIIIREGAHSQAGAEPPS